MTIRNFKVLYDCKNFSLYHSGGNHLKKKISILLIILLCLFQNSTISFAESSANDVSESSTENSFQESSLESSSMWEMGTVSSTEQLTETTESSLETSSESSLSNSSTTESTVEPDEVSDVPEKVEEQIDEASNKEMGTNFKTDSNKLARAGRSSVIAGNNNTPEANFIDVSSHNGTISVSDYKEMIRYGVTGVVVKATEGTSYKNSYYFEGQVKNALAAGLKVSVYHYAHYTTAAKARAEADYFASYVESIGILDKSVNMVIDIEENAMKNGSLSLNTIAFKNRLNSLGFSNVLYYTSASWITEYGDGGELSANTFGYQNIWIAHYPTNLTSNMNWYSKYASWQWSSVYVFPSKSDVYFDINQDYGGRFTNKDLLDNGNVYYFKNTFSAGNADLRVVYGRPEDVTYFGDWNGDGKDTFVVRRGNMYYFKDSLSSGEADVTISFGRDGDQVYFGDWDGDGKDTIAVRRDNKYYFKNDLSDGEADFSVAYGRGTDDCYFGDWDGDGKETVTVRRENIFHIKNSISYGNADIMIAYGKPDDEIFIGDWNGDQVDGLVVRRLNAYHIKNNLTTSGVAERVVTYGKATDRVYFGDWTGTGLESIVVRR
ncbi:hypothetical protein RU94_GL001442 [Enterococcus asini]|nr:hypothetical protein RU94_GL001442 [Enterococcus asini]